MSPTTSLQALLFDHDGTLVDSEPLHHQFWVQALQPLGVHLSEEEYRLHDAGLPTSTNAVKMVARYQLDLDPAALAAAKHQAEADFLAKHAFPLMPGALEVLHSCQALGLRLALVTGSGRAGIAATLRVYGLESLFSAVVTREDVTHSKPAPDPYLLALQRLQLSAAQTLALEDTEHGVAAATAAGIRCVAIPNAMSQHHNFALAHSVQPSLNAAWAWLNLV